MKTNSTLIKKSLLVLGIFCVTTFVIYGATSIPDGTFKSTPYTVRSSAADADLSRLTNGAGAAILDGVIAKVKAKALEKAGNPVNVTTYNAYIDDRLSLMNKLDNDVRAELGSDYAFIFKYAYPRVHELKREDTRVASVLERFGNVMGVSSGNENTNSVNTNIATTEVLSPSGTLSLSQNNNTITPSEARYSFDSTKGDVMAKWDIKNAEGCWLDSGYEKNGVAYTLKTNGGDFLAAKSEEVVKLHAPDGGKFYDIRLVCGAKSKGWMNSSGQPTKAFFIDILSNVIPPAPVPAAFVPTCVDLTYSFQCEQAMNGGYKKLIFSNGNTQIITAISDCTATTFSYMTTSSQTGWNGYVGAGWKACTISPSDQTNANNAATAEAVARAIADAATSAAKLKADAAVKIDVTYYQCRNKEKDASGKIVGIKSTYTYTKAQWTADARPVGFPVNSDNMLDPSGSSPVYTSCDVSCTGPSSSFLTLCGPTTFKITTNN